MIDPDTNWSDAMRWAPPWDEPVVHPPLLMRERLVAEGWDGYAIHGYELLAVRQLGRRAQATVRSLTESLTEVGRLTRKAFEQFSAEHARRIAERRR